MVIIDPEPRARHRQVKGKGKGETLNVCRIDSFLPVVTSFGHEQEAQS